MRIAPLLGVLLLASGCVVRTHGPLYPYPAPVPSRRPPPPPPPPRPSTMSRDEAVNLGFNFCRSRSYDCQLKEAHLTGNDVWKVKFRAFAPGARGHVHLEYNAYSRALLRVDERVKSKGGHGHGHGKHGRDWDDDDDD